MSQNRFLLFIITLVAFSSCSKTPEHAKYIPKDAMAVVGINTKELSKKLAWDAIMGSKLLDEMKSKEPKNTEAAEGLGNAGIDALNTTYFYYTPGATKESHSHITALVPLSDVKKWEAYLQKNFSGSAFKEVNKRKETMLEDGLYAAWTDDLAIVQKAISVPNYQEAPPMSYGEDSLATPPLQNASAPMPDASKMSADIQAAFTINKDNNITKDKRFSKLQGNGNDISFWMNYDVFMRNMNSYSGDFMGGLALGNSLWKDAVYTAGIDFDKGKIEAEMNYYLSKELTEIYSKIGNKNVDKEMIDRLPAQNINLLTALNISSEGTKAMLEKMGLLGFMSLALMQSDLTADDVFQSFSGDMAVAINDLALTKITDTTALYGRQEKMDMNFLFVLKINKKEKFDKLLNYVKSQGAITSIDATTYQFGGSEDIFVSVDKGYAVISNKAASAKNYINGDYKSQAKPDKIKKEIYGHPMGMFVDFQSVINGMMNGASSEKDKNMMQLSKNTLQDVVINGGENKKELFTFNGVLNLVNKEENSLLQLMDYSYKVNELNKNRP